MKRFRLSLILVLCMAGPLWAGSRPACPDPPAVDRELYGVLEKARKSLAGGRNRAALELLSAYAAAHPRIRHYHLSFLMGTAHFRLKQPAQAEACFTSAAAILPCRAEAWENIGAVRSAGGNYAGAAAALSVAYRLSPPDRRGWRNLGDLYRLAGVPIQAVQAYRKAFGDDPVPGDLDRLADTWLAARNLEQALESARLAAAKAPTAKRWARVGDICFHLGDLQASIAAYRKGAALDDGDGRMSLKEGMAALKLKRLTDAEACFARTLCNASPESATARDAAKCIEVLQAAKKDAPSSERGMN
ncbi:tetratricopeptide repeat protein [Desulfococcus sp.]|uniref:tetratricopeptide repeat protein n=1 Tax=Desulfococcus sp. TaxID=2025834 RepID=UPI003593601C